MAVFDTLNAIPQFSIQSKKTKQKTPTFLILLVMHAYSIILDCPPRLQVMIQTQVSSTVEQIKQGFSVGVGARPGYPRTEFLFPRSTFSFLWVFLSFKAAGGYFTPIQMDLPVLGYPDTCPKKQMGTREYNYPTFPPLVVLNHISWQP